jgi:O-antigen biosynthesis protein
MFHRIARVLKKSNIARQIYRISKGIDFSYLILQITPITVKTSKFDFERINLLVPSINKEHFYGGISTAFKIFDEMINKTNKHTKARIIVTDAVPNKEAVREFSKYQLVSFDDDVDVKCQLLPVTNKYQKNIFVSKNDKFIATAWWTAYSSQEIIRQQLKLYNQDYHKLVYIIQDFEPGFYNWSSHFVLAESTYRSEIPTIAIFNSSLLKSFFNARGYNFFKEYYFEPQMNETLKQHIDLKTSTKKKQVLIYGRPSVDRNSFSLIIEALKIVVLRKPDIHEWIFYSAGESHSDIVLGNGVVLRSMGKLSLDDYAKILKESAIGISLMISPHPSYPPLEMAHFGVLTITNSFANKDLSQWHQNIISIDILTPQNLCNTLVRAMEKYNNNCNIGWEGKSFIEYVNDDMNFGFIDDLLNTMQIT